jgi:hypothetical protein
MDIASCGVDMGVPEQCLHYRQIHPGLGHCGTEGVTQSVRVTGQHS